MNGLTIEEELNLIKGRKTPDQPPPAAPAEAAPAAPPAATPDLPAVPPQSAAPDTAAAPAKTPEQIDAELGLPPAETGLPPMPGTDAGTWDVIAAAWKAETVRTDTWNDTVARRNSLSETLWNRLPEEARARVNDQWRKGYAAGGWPKMTDLIVAEAGRLAATSPEAAADWAGLPLSPEAFDQQIDAGRRADLDEAQAVLDQPGGAIAEFVGTGARAMTDPTSLMLLPFGVSGSFWRMIASEAALGAAGEAAVLPREFRVAQELGLPDPDPVSRIALGAAFGGGLSAALHGLGRGINALRARAEARRASLSETRPEGRAAVEHEADIDEAEAALRGDQTPEERLPGLATPAAGATPADGTLGDILATPPGAGPAYVGVAEAGKGYTVLVGPDGKAVRREGSRNWRNNNPGNIEFGPFARSMGAIGTDGRFAVFPTYEMGRKAKQTLLWGSKGYRGKTIAGAIARYAPAFENPTEAYTRAITRALGVPADTPMSALTPAQREVMMDAMERVEGFKPGTENGVPARAPRKGISTPLPDEDTPSFGSTTRGYTGSNQIAVGDDMRIDVEYEVVDYSTLIRSSGDLQPRDRSRINSDEWVSATAARLDPALLMPSPSAATGAPIVGPDNIIESGNGRSMAIARAYERHPDRALAYRDAIEAAGFPIPEGVERPVLIARRLTDLTPDERRQMVVTAQDSGVARMNATETAMAYRDILGADVLARLQSGADLDDALNADFARAVTNRLPRSERNAMVDKEGGLNGSGVRSLGELIFARAWSDPDIVALKTEVAPREMRSLVDALDEAAPAWTALKADIEAGLVPEAMDISAHVMDAVRFIALARQSARREKMPIAQAMADLLNSPDMIDGAISPLTVALLRKFWSNGRAAPTDKIASFLIRYADDARKAGRIGGLLDAPGPRDVLRAIDPDTFADLPEDLGTPRGFATPGARPAGEAPPDAVATVPEAGFDQGARSPEAEAADAGIEDALRNSQTGPFGPVFRGFANDPAGAIAHILKQGRGEVADAFANAQSRLANVALVYGDASMGLRHIQLKRPHLIDRIPEVMQRGDVYADPDGQPRLYVVDWTAPPTFVVVRLDWDGAERHWIVTAIDDEKGKFSDRAQWEAYRFTETEARVPASPDPAKDTTAAQPAQSAAQPAPPAPDLSAARRDFGAFADAEILLPDGTTARAADVLDDLDADRAADAVLQACGLTPNGGPQ